MADKALEEQVGATEATFYRETEASTAVAKHATSPHRNRLFITKDVTSGAD